ncbi:hypothetical protein Sarmat_00894 [Rickettsiales endosymbiont of Paramecium tredecaurelia]|uniref:DUF2659 family protein n=1 Tax=Candidatus Sarmatiella mevalonica TaxID=2770581 RepID=UPI001920C95F|nr:hypothetical protein [Candidatus Sarmatiella mevalonica]MBL3285030.1 hypothetical protein [Candidatus Sarmatiella mevalonica]
MTDLIDEVKNETHQNKTVAVFKFFLYTSLMILLVVVIAMTIYNTYQSNIRNKNVELSAILLKAKEPDEVLNINLDDLYQLLPKYKAAELILLKSLSQKLNQNEMQQAEQILDNILAHTQLRPITRSCALVMYNSYCLNLEEIDANRKYKLDAYIGAVRAHEPLYHYSQLLYVLWQIKSGEIGSARELLSRNEMWADCSNKLKRYTQMILLSLDKNQGNLK